MVNDHGDKIGSLDDILISRPDRVLFAVLSVGGFLGVGSRLVVVPFTSLVLNDQGRRVTRPGATKEELEKLPPFHFA